MNPRIDLENVSLESLRQKFHAIWLRGSDWRYDVGEVLSQIKEKCEYGQWGDFLAEYDLPRSSADDYIRSYKDNAQITETRQFEEPNPELAPDPEADERKAAIAAEKERRKDKPRQHHPTEVRVRLKDLRPDQTSEYWQERAADPDRVDKIWFQAFLTIVRADLAYPPPLPDFSEPPEEAPALLEGPIPTDEEANEMWDVVVGALRAAAVGAESEGEALC
jgi:hypothetical protein